MMFSEDLKCAKKLAHASTCSQRTIALNGNSMFQYADSVQVFKYSFSYENAVFVEQKHMFAYKKHVSKIYVSYTCIKVHV